jgi:LemA protein
MNKRWLFVPMMLLLSGCGYNRIQELDELAKRARANIDAELLRRNDLIPNLVATVEGAAAFESQTYTNVAQARAGLNTARQQLQEAVSSNAEAGELSRANAAVTDNLRQFINVSVEAYPQLRANQNFIALQDELTETENRISVSRRDYNDSVAQYNTYIRQFPAALTAKVTGAQTRETFEAPAGSERAPRVDFKPPAATP